MMRFCLACAVAIVTALFLAGCGTASGGGGRGAWLQYRGDQAFTGHSTLKGNIVAPEVKWKHFVGLQETLLAVRFGAGDPLAIDLPNVAVNSDQRKALLDRWAVAPPMVDLDGDGQTTISPPSIMYKIGRFLPDRPGLQKVEFESCFARPGMVESSGRLLERRNGEWVEVWKSPPIPRLFSPNVIVGDFDSDGSLEIAVVAIDDIYLLDLRTGAIRDKCRFVQPGMESGRGYGWFEAFDVDAEGKQEFIIVGDHQEQVDVIGWENDKLKLLWAWIPELIITGKHTVLKPGTNPVADVDGDRMMEVSVCVFDETNDGRWHTVVLDGMTGQRKLDLPDRALTGICDVDRDGVSELFLTRTLASRLIPDPSALWIIACKDGRPIERWRADGLSFQKHDLQDFPTNVNSGATNARKTVLTGSLEQGGSPLFFTRKSHHASAGTTELTAWRAESDGKIRPLASVSGPHAEALAVLSGEGILVQVQAAGSDSGKVRVSGCGATVMVSAPTEIPVTPALVARLSPGKAPAVVVQGACEELVAFQPPAERRPVKQLWRVSGRGAHHGGDLIGGGFFGGPMLADMDGSGRITTIAATRGPVGQGRIVLLDAAGNEVWHHDFDEVPGEPPGWNLPGVAFWYPGHFTNRDHRDVLVNLRLSQDNILVLLDGRTGRELWRRTEMQVVPGVPTRRAGCGGMWMAIYDYDGDGLDDALCMYYAAVSVFKGTNAELLLLKDMGPDGIFSGLWFGSNFPVVADLVGNGRQQMLYWWNKARSVIGHDGRVVWCEPNKELAGTYRKSSEIIWHESEFLNATLAALPGVGDFDGDGRLELIAPGDYYGEAAKELFTHCYDAATGNLKWELKLGPAAGAVASPATADIDGDGRCECVFPVGRTLYAVGATKDGKGGEVRWKLALPGDVGPPAIADADGTGKAQIIVTCTDGHVYGIGGG